MKIEIFAAPNCGPCEAAKAMLREHHLEFVEFNIGSPASMAAFRSRLPGAWAIPQILIDGRHIGGYKELRLREARGDLGRGACTAIGNHGGTIGRAHPTSPV